MTRFLHLLTGTFIAMAAMFQPAPSCALADEDAREYPFVRLNCGNQNDRMVCFGLAGLIAGLEEATEIDGETSVEKLAKRIWMNLRDPEEILSYSRYTRLRDGMRVPTCSKSAVRELALLLQAKYEHLVNDELWQTGVEPDPDTATGRVLLETRQKYLARYEDRITSKRELKALIENDKDGLVALAGRGERRFQDGPPQKLIDKYSLTIDPQTQSYPAVPSHHAFLVTYNKDDDSFYVYDSDDPDRKWEALVHGSGDQFMLDWYIQDHMGNGPSHQTYFDLKPLRHLVSYVGRIVDERGTNR